MKSLSFLAIFYALILFGVAGARLCGQIVFNNDLVVLLTEDFTGGLGPGPGQVSWTGSGGFAAVGGDRVVQIGGSPAMISWASQYFIGNGNTLILGDPNADGTLIWDKALNLGGANRRIRVLHGAGNSTRADARLDRQLRGINLTFEGDGRIDMTVDNPFLNRMITIEGAELRLNTNGRLSSIRRLSVSMGGAFVIDNAGTSSSATGGNYISDRFNDTTADIRLNAGLFHYIGQTGAGNSIEDIFWVSLDQGSNTIDIINNRSDFITEVRVNQLRVSILASTVNFISSSGVSGFGDGANFKSALVPLYETNGILRYATVNGADWATYKSENGAYTILAYWDYDTGAQTDWNSTVNASPIFDQVLNTNRTVNSLRLTGGRTVDLAQRTLTINAGALLSTGATNNVISGGLLSLRLRSYVHVYNTGDSGLTISSAIRGSIFTKTGPGRLTYSGSNANVFTQVYVNEGMLVLGKTAGVVAVAGSQLTIGDRGHSAIVRLDNHEQIADTTAVWLRGGYADPARHVKHEAVLQFNGAGGAGLRETFKNLVVEGRGVIDFQGGTLAAPNYLRLEDLDVRYGIEGGSVLLVRNWVEFEDRLLVRRTSANLTASLPHIHFEGYAPGAVTRDYNAQYYEVVPYPEPSTYGAIFGTVGLALALRSKRRPKLKKSH